MYSWQPAWGIQPAKAWTFAKFSPSDINRTIQLKSGFPDRIVLISYRVSSLLHWWCWLYPLICLTCGKRSAWWDAWRNCLTFYGCRLRQRQTYCPCWRCLRGTGWGRTPSLDVFAGRTASTRSVESPLQEADRTCRCNAKEQRLD